MKVEIYPGDAAVAAAAARFVAGAARTAVAERGRFTLAVSGGHTPWQMLRRLAAEDVPWPHVEILQVDERMAPAGDPDRNLTHLHASLLEHVPIQASQIHAMPVEEIDLDAAAALYSRTLVELCGDPATVDLVHLGLGPDGHTASLVPGDPVLEITQRDVGVTGPYQGRRRLTLTYPVLDRARQVLWLVTGESKLTMLPRLLRADPTIPAGRVLQSRATLFADQVAAGAIPPDAALPYV